MEFGLEKLIEGFVNKTVLLEERLVAEGGADDDRLEVTSVVAGNLDMFAGELLCQELFELLGSNHDDLAFSVDC